MHAEYHREKFVLRLRPQQLALANLPYDFHLFPASGWFKELLEEGVGARIRRYATAAAVLREGFERLGLRLVLPPALRSSSITSLWLPPGRTYAALHDALKARGFVIYEGQGRLAREIFRVANMGHLGREDFERFLAALGAVLGS